MLTASIKELTGPWVFKVTDADTGEVLWYGCEPIRTIPTLRELRRHALHSMPERVTVELISPALDMKQGEDIVEGMKILEAPRYSSVERRQHSSPVQCVDTGEVYDNPAQAAKAIGVAPSYLYMHLKGVPTASKCKGMKFKRL